jgi:hypothetical protein
MALEVAFDTLETLSRRLAGQYAETDDPVQRALIELCRKIIATHRASHMLAVNHLCGLLSSGQSASAFDYACEIRSQLEALDRRDAE